MKTATNFCCKTILKINKFTIIKFTEKWAFEKSIFIKKQYYLELPSRTSCCVCQYLTGIVVSLFKFSLLIKIFWFHQSLFPRAYCHLITKYFWSCKAVLETWFYSHPLTQIQDCAVANTNLSTPFNNFQGFQHLLTFTYKCHGKFQTSMRIIRWYIMDWQLWYKINLISVNNSLIIYSLWPKVLVERSQCILAQTHRTLTRSPILLV